MIVDLITTWQERCGIAEYALDLTQNVKGVEFNIHGRPFSAHDTFTGDIVHMIHGIGLVQMQKWMPEDVKRIKEQGRKTLITYCDTTSAWNGTALTREFDKVVVHEPVHDAAAIVIPHGIPVWKNPGIVPQSKIGTAGFPAPHKGFVELAGAAKELGIGFLAIAPESEHADTHAVMNRVRAAHPEAEIVTDWLSRADVMAKLAECEIVAFTHRNPYYNHTGISGSVRMGLATRRPTVITKHPQFKDLYMNYPDEIYLVDVDEPSYEDVRNVISQALGHPERKVPQKILGDMNWRHCGQMYKEVYSQLLA